mmetsp:Transcript_29770/g.80027  ORF Transcript_29770/g.80027 Transcript_29770/m.80027 type:complete len:303 (+) Transcript_29770:248-1156(+)
MGGAGTNVFGRWRSNAAAARQVEVKETIHWPLSTPPDQERRCALLLYGLPKFFKDRCFPTLEARILSRLPFPVDVFVHTYDLHETTNVRNNEAACRLFPEEVEVAHPVRVEMQDQGVVDKVHLAQFNELKRYGDAWFNHYVSLKNVLRQYNSLHRAYKLMELEQEEKGIQYTILCASRMDVLYLDNLPDSCVQSLAQLDPGTIFVPNFHEWELREDNLIYPTGGMNDRFAIGCRHAMRVYTDRVEHAVSFCRQRARMFHTETFLKWHLAQRRVTVRKMPFRFQRIRGSGDIHDTDRELGDFR